MHNKYWEVTFFILNISNDSFELVQRNIALGWKPISCNTVSFILAAITATYNSSLGMVNNLSFNGASLDFANMNMVTTLLLLSDLK